MTKFVKVTNSDTKTVYHTDEECHSLQTANQYEPFCDRNVEAMDLSECAYCAGENPNANVENDFSYHRLLREAGKENAD